MLYYMQMFKKSELEEKIIKMRREAEERDAQRRAQKNSLPYLSSGATPVNTEALALIPEEVAKKIKAAAIELKEKKVVLAVFDPNDEGVRNLVKQLELDGYEISIRVASLKNLEYIFDFYKFVSKKAKAIAGELRVEEEKILKPSEEFSSLAGLKEIFEKAVFGKEGPARLLDIVLAGALANQSSDVHFEPTENKVKLRVRIDGILHDVSDELETKNYKSLLSRIKLLSNLKLDVNDRPQDGRFSIKFSREEIEVRVAVAPSEFGEVAVMRLLDPKLIALSLFDLGIREDDLEIIKTELKRPNGLILNTGPTGSGKTTTLYAFLRHKKAPEIKTITIEDPIEYHLEGVEQTQVDEEAGYTFANGLKSLMRQDPDVILVGEIRDKETGEIGVQAALTGHLVFSTIHANSAAGAIPRLLDLGVKPSSIGPALNLVIAQRLVRRLCENCKTPQQADKDIEAKIEKFLAQLPERVNKEKFKEIKIFNSQGCLKCGGSGYKGRIGVYELLLNDPEYEKFLADSAHVKLSSHKELEELIMSSAPESAIKKFALAQGMVTMQQDGILKIISGTTSFEEVEAVTGPIRL